MWKQAIPSTRKSGRFLAPVHEMRHMVGQTSRVRQAPMFSFYRSSASSMTVCAPLLGEGDKVGAMHRTEAGLSVQHISSWPNARRRGNSTRMWAS